MPVRQKYSIAIYFQKDMHPHCKSRSVLLSDFLGKLVSKLTLYQLGSLEETDK